MVNMRLYQTFEFTAVEQRHFQFSEMIRMFKCMLVDFSNTSELLERSEVSNNVQLESQRVEKVLSTG